MPDSLLSRRNLVTSENEKRGLTPPKVLWILFDAGWQHILKDGQKFPQVLSRGRVNDNSLSTTYAFDFPHTVPQSLETTPYLRRAKLDE